MCSYSSVIKCKPNTFFTANFGFDTGNWRAIMGKREEPKLYRFSWELIGYDCAPPRVRSPTFKVNFAVTEWFVELDLSKLQNLDSFIPFRLERIAEIGPHVVALDITITVKLSENEDFKLVMSRTAMKFSKEENFWTFDINIPSYKLKSKDGELDWLTSKNLLINIEMESPKEIGPEFSKQYWYSENSHQALIKDLKTLLSPDKEHAFFAENYHDLVVTVPGNEYKLHKCIINARWPTLMSALKISTSKSFDDPVETKEFSAIPHAILEHLFAFAYHGDLGFMHGLHEVADGMKIFDFVKELNFYRLNDKITQLPPKCGSSQIFQSYRTSVQMKFANVTSTETAMCDFRTCEIPLKPKQLPKIDKSIPANVFEKFCQHIRFMDLRLYVDKGPFGYNWLMFSIVLGKIPQENPVVIQCKLYVVDESNVRHLLTEQNFVIDRRAEISFSTPFGQEKVFKRYCKTSEPVITWEELTDKLKGLMRKRKARTPRIWHREKSNKIKSFDKTVEEDYIDSTPDNIFLERAKGKDVIIEKDPPIETIEEKDPPIETIEEKDIYFRFEIKLSDGEYVYDMRHGECEFKYEPDYKIFQDLGLMLDDNLADIVLTSGSRCIKAHKAILAARSPRILKTIRATQRNLKSLPIEIEPEYLHVFLHYLYTGHIEEVPFDKIDHLIFVAEEYGIENLKELLIENKAALKLVANA